MNQAAHQGPFLSPSCLCAPECCEVRDQVPSTGRVRIGYGLILIASLMIFALTIVWRWYVPGVVTAETSQRFFGPAMSVSGSLLVAVSISGAAVITRIGPKHVVGELIWFFLAVLFLVAGLLMSAWGVVSGTTDSGTVVGLVIAIPYTWLFGSILL